MASLTEWKVPPSAQPRPEDYGYDLERALSAVVGLHSIIPPDAFTADTLGIERAGNGVLIGDGLVLTIGYLITEAETIWLHLGDGRVVEGHALGFDQETGFGLVQALAKLDLPPLPLGSSRAAELGERVVLGGAGGRTRSVAGRIAAKQEFAGYWEYVLDEAIFTYPAHPNWGGTGLISPKGELLGIGSLQLERAREGKNEHLNMVVPIDLLKPILDDLRKFGRVNKPARPWLGALFDRDRGQGRGRRHRAEGAGGARRDQDRRRRSWRSTARSVSTLAALLPQGLGARRGRRRSAADALSRGRHLRCAGEFIRPRQVPQGAADALRRKSTAENDWPRLLPRRSQQDMGGGFVWRTPSRPARHLGAIAGIAISG